jgi:uncharacterized membrane protein YbhN (UPF0104 family)
LRNRFIFLKAGLALAVLAYLVYAVDAEAVLQNVAGAEGGWIAAAVLLLPANLLLEGLGWHLLVRRQAPEAGLQGAFGGLLSGYALGLFTPARLGEYAGRAYYLGHPDKGTLLAVAFLERTLGLVVAVDVGLLAYFYFLANHLPGGTLAWQALAGYGAGTALILSGLLLFPALAHHLLEHVLPFRRVRRHAAFLRGLTGRFMLLLFGIGLLRYGVYCTQFLLLLRALTPDLALFPAALGVALVFFAKYLVPPVTLMDLGIREGAAVFFLGHLGYPEPVAFNAAFLLFCTNLILPALLGLPFVFRMKLGKG